MVILIASIPLCIQTQIAEKMDFNDFKKLRESSKYGRELGEIVKPTMDIPCICIYHEGNQQLFQKTFNRLREKELTPIPMVNTKTFPSICPRFCVKQISEKKNEKSGDCRVKKTYIDLEHHEVSYREESAVCEMPSKVFQMTCQNLAMYTETLNITTKKNRIDFTHKRKARSSSIDFWYHAEYDPYMNIDIKENVTLSFSMKHMLEITKATKLSNRTHIKLYNNGPCIIELPIEEEGYMRYFLAPNDDN